MHLLAFEPLLAGKLHSGNSALVLYASASAFRKFPPHACSFARSPTINLSSEGRVGNVFLKSSDLRL